MMNVKISFGSESCRKSFGIAFSSATDLLCGDILKDSDQFVPYDTGRLSKSGKLGHGGIITYSAPYARRMYYHKGNMSKLKHKDASPLWFDASKSRNLQKWIRSTEQRVLSRR